MDGDPDLLTRSVVRDACRVVAGRDSRHHTLTRDPVIASDHQFTTYSERPSGFLAPTGEGPLPRGDLTPYGTVGIRLRDQGHPAGTRLQRGHPGGRDLRHARRAGRSARATQPDQQGSELTALPVVDVGDRYRGSAQTGVGQMPAEALRPGVEDPREHARSTVEAGGHVRGRWSGGAHHLARVEGGLKLAVGRVRRGRDAAAPGRRGEGAQHETTCSPNPHPVSVGGPSGRRGSAGGR
jgi:hypothetical protein